MLIRTGDMVEVIAGADRGQKSRVILVDRAAGKALVEGVNRVYKHVHRSQKNPQGGRLSKEMPVQLSNLKYVCDSCGKRRRLGARFLEDGSKERFCRKCGTGGGATICAAAKPGIAKKKTKAKVAAEKLNGERSHGHNSTSACRAVRKRDFAAFGGEARSHESALAAEAREDRRQHGRRLGHCGQEEHGSGRRAPWPKSPARSRSGARPARAWPISACARAWRSAAR